MQYILPAILAFFLTKQLHAQQVPPYQKAVAGFQYIETTNGSAKKNLPLIIAFHYSSGNPVATLADYEGLQHPARIIIPKGNYPKRDGYSYYPADYYQKDSLTQFSLAKKAVDSLAAFINAIEKTYKQKAIVTGISQGGDIALLLAVYYPQYCKASFPFAAVIHPGMIEYVKKNPVSKIPICLFQGEADEIVKVETTRKKIKEIGESLQIDLFTYPGLGHDISPEMKTDYLKRIDELIR